jgi:hypothetical protein
MQCMKKKRDYLHYMHSSAIKIETTEHGMFSDL